MTPPQPQRPRQTILGNLTQAGQTLLAKVNFSQLALKPNARVPELWVQDANAPKAETYPLLGDRYTLGRSSSNCDIVVHNPVVSQVHMSLTRQGRNGTSFILKDENSTNGIYIGRHRIKSLPLRHGDTFTLGPPELAQAVKITFRNPPPRYIQVLLYSLYGIGGLTGLLALAVIITASKVSVSNLKEPTGPVVVYSKDLETPLRLPGNSSHADLAKLSDFSPYLPKALIASEDSRFYWHFGVDPWGTLRAVLVTSSGESRQGGSTLTQQVARSVFRKYVGTENSLGRKLREAVVALKLETFYSKNDILLTYMNRVYLGVDTSGFDDAARHYFGKKALDLTLSEAAMLVGILPSPNNFNPCKNYQMAVKRRNLVIGRMVSVGAISQAQAREARRSRIEVTNPHACEPIKDVKAPYFYVYVFNELQQLLGEDFAKEGNLYIETGLDLQMQQKAEASLSKAVRTSGANSRFSQGAMVTLDSSTGIIRALTGGVDYQQSQFDRATEALRQPGSTFKLFTYTAAIEQGISPRKSYSCAPLTWQNQRFKACEHVNGSADMYTGIALSENAIALRVAQDVGLDKVVEMAKRLGIKSKLNPVPGLVLGESVVHVLEMTGAYGAVANRGVWNRPHAIKRILDSSDCSDRSKPETCRVIYSDTDGGEASKKVVLQPAVADTVNNLLRGVVQRGTATSANLGLGEEAGKTGTTNNNVDLWFIGYVPSSKLVTGIWLGNDDNSPTSGSSAQAAQLWGNYMRRVIR